MKTQSKTVDEKILTLMQREMKTALPIYQPSIFWQNLGAVHNQQLTIAGFTNFKRSVNMRYFNWRTLGILCHQLGIVIEDLKKGSMAPFFSGSFSGYKSTNGQIKQFNIINAFIYKMYVVAFADYLKKTDRLQLLVKLKEPPIGNPFIIKYKDMVLSQDLCNSIHEFYSIVNNIGKMKLSRVVELGAGYGRLADCFLKILPQISYCIIDIPPALFISQKYLTKLFPREKIFTFRPFTSFEKVKSQFVPAKIAFLMPHQIPLLPRNYFDLFINISSLHEMTRDRIENYLTQADRITKGYFYSKQWRRSRVRDNQYMTENEYPKPARWQQVFKRSPHPVQKMFFDVLYRV